MSLCYADNPMLRWLGDKCSRPQGGLRPRRLPGCTPRRGCTAGSRLTGSVYKVNISGNPQWESV